MNRIQDISGTDSYTKWRYNYPYLSGDLVSYCGIIYECIKDNKDENPNNSSYWKSAL